MKFASIVASLATAGTLVAAQPHGHHHHHLVRREASPGAAIATAYQLNNHLIDAADAQEGIKNGSLVLVSGEPQPAPTAKPSPKVSAQALYEQTSSIEASTSSTPPPPPSSTASPSTSAAPAPSPASSGSDSGSSGSTSGVDADFPDGTLDCSHFPSDYGAVSLKGPGLGGWSGIQKAQMSGDGQSVTDAPNAESGETCKEGNFCSYACPSGYQKAQWPTTQGATKQSIGGIQCKGGKLYLTNSQHKTLCIKGTGGVKVQNKVGQPVPVCRTDYPGTESETIPASLDISSSTPYELTCPDQKSYYQWDGAQTSAQYYVNPAGTTLEDGCSWNTAGSNKGNWAPLNLGVSSVDGTKWLAILPNAPTNPGAKLGFSVKIVSTGNPDPNNACSYDDANGYCQGSKCSWTAGCTSAVTGDATYVLGG